jgi:hypothetical protein
MDETADKARAAGRVFVALSNSSKVHAMCHGIMCVVLWKGEESKKVAFDLSTVST